jgi:hypothetical protein
VYFLGDSYYQGETTSINIVNIQNSCVVLCKPEIPVSSIAEYRAAFQSGAAELVRSHAGILVKPQAQPSAQRGCITFKRSQKNLKILTVKDT